MSRHSLASDHRTGGNAERTCRLCSGILHMSNQDEIKTDLWNSSVDSVNYPDGIYQQHVLEQYKLCLELADRISQRRAIANTFFLSFNTAIIGALVVFFDAVNKPAAIVFYVTVIGFCVAWGVLLRAYRSINMAKFRVIGLLEERLPASPFWSAEWKALGEGKNYRKYIPLSAIETSVPIGFLIAYGYLAVITIA